MLVEEYAAQVLSVVQQTPDSFVSPALDEKGKRNAGTVMLRIITERLAAGGNTVERQKGSRFAWKEGVVLIRNSRVANGFWSNLPSSQLDTLAEVARSASTVMVLCHFELEQEVLHVWAIPANVALVALRSVAPNKNGFRTIFIYPSDQRFHQAADSEDLTPFYRQVPLSDSEAEALVAAIKQDEAAKELSASDNDDDEEVAENISSTGYSQDTVDYLVEGRDRGSSMLWWSRVGFV
ncbi:MAG: hypothetical protein ACKVII_12065, partial [Planctomycetales bacterium]